MKVTTKANKLFIKKKKKLQCSSLSVQDSVYALGNAHMHSVLSLRSFPKVASETVHNSKRDPTVSVNTYCQKEVSIRVIHRNFGKASGAQDWTEYLLTWRLDRVLTRRQDKTLTKTGQGTH